MFITHNASYAITIDFLKIKRLTLFNWDYCYSNF